MKKNKRTSLREEMNEKKKKRGNENAKEKINNIDYKNFCFFLLKIQYNIKEHILTNIFNQGENLSFILFI